MSVWQKRAGDVAREYTANKRELGRRKRYDRKCPGDIGMPKSRGIAKPVEAIAMEISSNERIGQLEREIAAVDWAYSRIKQIKTAEAAQLAEFVNMLYIRRAHPSVERAADVLFLSRRTAFRYNRMFLRLVASKMGYLGE